MTTRVAERVTGGVTDLRCRIAVFHGTPVNAVRACELDEQEIVFDTFMRNGVKATNLIVAGLGPVALKQRGVEHATGLRLLGYDALHLCDPDLCNEASMAYGARSVVSAFLVSARDAVCIAGSEAQHILGINTTQLLEHCAGCPSEALAVMEQLPQGVSLEGVPCVVLLDAGLRADTLKAAGYGLASVIGQVGPTGVELAKLGYTF